jgi:phosphate:Na+ symporter
MGMQTMQSATAFFDSGHEFFVMFGEHPILGFLAGMIVTMIVQSSAATIGLTIAMASQGILTIDAAIPIIFGENMGTTLTAVIATIGANRAAKQAAAAHVLFNVIGLTIFMIFLTPYKEFILLTATGIERQLANSHTFFNIMNTMLFLPFTSQFARLIQIIIPDRDDVRAQGPIYLDKNLIKASPTAAVEAVKDELLHMGDIALSMADIVRRCFKEKSPENIISEFAKAESAVNQINREISSYASEIWQNPLSSDVTKVLGCYVNAAGDLERVGDHFDNLTEMAEALAGDNFSEEADTEMWAMYDTAVKALSYALDSIKREDAKKADIVIKDLEKQIDKQEKQYRKNHIERLNRGECDPQRGVIFIDILSNLERIGDHSHNIAYFTHDIVALSKHR